MHRRQLALHISLAVLVFATTTCCVQVFAKTDAPGKHSQPAQPLEDSEEKSELRDGVDNAVPSPLDRHSVNDGVSPHWTPVLVVALPSSNVYLCRPDLSRAPPTA